MTEVGLKQGSKKSDILKEEPKSIEGEPKSLNEEIAQLEEIILEVEQKSEKNILM